MPSTLTFRSGALAGRRISLRAEGTVLGREADPSCHLVLGNVGVSGQHAVILRENGRWIVRDLGSRNGTFINDQPVNDVAELQPGAVLLFADVEAVYDEAPPSTPGTPPTLRSPLPSELMAPQPLPSEPVPQPDLMKTLRQGSGLIRQGGRSGAALVTRLRTAVAELERAVGTRDPELTRQSVNRLLEDGGALSGLADELGVVFETTERSLDYFDRQLREAEELAKKSGG